MASLFSIIALGFFLGMRHATDADHVIAVSTIVTRQRSLRSAALIGAIWGVGHTLTIVAVGAAIILFGLVIPARVGLSMEFSVGLMLIVLGVLNLTGVMRWISETFSSPAAVRDAAGHAHPVHVHSHAHAHGDYVHTHAHSHGPERHPHRPEQNPLGRLDRWFGRLGFYQAVRPLVVGVVHGMAGSAAVALLVLATIRDARWAVLYLLVFGAGTIAGMALITVALAGAIHYTQGRSAWITRNLATASGLISLGFGLFIAWEVGFLNGLFRAVPHWSPK
ncbi:MAG TPA: high-affinity nickel-transport family protein [Terriglobales bacterium]|nr:high-affinity nickel-transport family protein [Terriglobales bacterium]